MQPMPMGSNVPHRLCSLRSTCHDVYFFTMESQWKQSGNKNNSENVPHKLPKIYF
jgi:hypothetical protein